MRPEYGPRTGRRRRLGLALPRQLAYMESGSPPGASHYES